MKDKSKNGITIILVLACIIGIILIFCLPPANNNSSKSDIGTDSIKNTDYIAAVKAQNATPKVTSDVSSNSDEDGLTHAEIKSEYFIKPLMKYPEEVNFEGDRRGHKTDENSYLVFEKFTAKNAMGVKTEYVYKIDMHYKGGDWTDSNNWEYHTAIIEDTNTGEQHSYYGGE